MLDAQAIEADIKRAHADFGELSLYTAEGERVQGFFLTQTLDGEMPAADEAGEQIRKLRSPSEYPLGTTITDRKLGRTWQVSAVMGDEGAYIHQLRLA